MGIYSFLTSSSIHWMNVFLTFLVTLDSHTSCQTNTRLLTDFSQFVTCNMSVLHLSIHVLPLIQFRVGEAGTAAMG